MAADPQERRIRSRARTLSEETPDVDADAEARGLIEDSDERQEDPATLSLEPDHVERRTSEDTTPPPTRS